MRNFLCLLLFSVGCHKEPDPAPAPVDPIPAEVMARYAEVLAHAQAHLDGDGWVIRREPTGEISNTGIGDSLIMTATFLIGAPCAEGAASEQSLAAMINANGGKPYRHPSLPGKISMDGPLVMYRAIASRIKRCFGSKELWGTVLPVDSPFWDNPLNEVQRVDMPPGFVYVRDLLKQYLHPDAPPSLVPAVNAEEALRLEDVAAAWTALVNAKHAACYRVNLAVQALFAVQELGGVISSQGRANFCASARGLHLPHVSFFCGEVGELDSFLAGFVANQWEYRFQRCPSWETPDGQNLTSAGVDFLEGVRLRYNLP